MHILLSDLLNTKHCFDNLYSRLDGLNQNKSEWVRHAKHIVDKHNNIVHFTIEIKPVEAVSEEHHLWVNWHLCNNATRARACPEIKEGQMIRIMIKKEI